MKDGPYLEGVGAFQTKLVVVDEMVSDGTVRIKR